MPRSKAAVFIFLLSIPTAQASELSYFDSKINFWDSEKPVHSEKTVAHNYKQQLSNFPWIDYLDPKNKEFFKEGDYTPPEPFMEIARNPNDENIKNWFEFMQKKNELARRLDSRMQEYMAKNGMPTPVPAPPVASEQKEPAQKSVAVSQPVSPDRFRIRMYFDSKCPHCHKMFSVLAKLKGQGFSVEALQVDQDPVPEDERIVPISHADPADIKKHGIQGVPYLLIADLKRKALLPAIEGFHDYGEVMQLLSAAGQ